MRVHDMGPHLQRHRVASRPDDFRVPLTTPSPPAGGSHRLPASTVLPSPECHRTTTSSPFRIGVFRFGVRAEGSSVSFRRSTARCFLGLNNVPLCGRATVHLCVHPPKGMLVASKSGQLRAKLLWTPLCACSCARTCSLRLSKYTECGCPLIRGEPVLLCKNLQAVRQSGRAPPRNEREFLLFHVPAGAGRPCSGFWPLARVCSDSLFLI